MSHHSKIPPAEPITVKEILHEHGQLYILLAVGAGSKFLRCDDADLVGAESIERRAREYFGAEYRLANEWNPAIGNAMLQEVVG